MRNLAIIPARSGSKGLKDKNIKLLDGKPLLAYTIDAAVKSKQFDTVHLSTDSEKYAEIGGAWGAECDFLRSTANAADCSQTSDAVKEVIERYSKQGRLFDSVTILQPTSPLRTHRDIESAFKLFMDKDALAVVSICESDHPIDWFHCLSNNGSMEDFVCLNHAKRRQESKVYYRVNGAIYLMQTEIALNMQKLYGDRTFGYEMPRIRSIDIDDEFDFDIAEYVMRMEHFDSLNNTEI